jgi:hypothetical protein
MQSIAGTGLNLSHAVLHLIISLDFNRPFCRLSLLQWVRQKKHYEHYNRYAPASLHHKDTFLFGI